MVCKQNKIDFVIYSQCKTMNGKIAVEYIEFLANKHPSDYLFLLAVSAPALL